MLCIATDEQIKEDITNQLYWDPRVDSSNVKVEVDSGEVRLDGNVTSYQSKRAAFYDSYQVAGVRSVVNALQVKPLGEAREDAELAEGIRKSLMWDSNVDSTDVQVDVNAGIATLKGSVDAYWRKDQAERIAENVSGILAVNNELSIVPTENPSDEALAKSITDALKRNRYVNCEDVNVKVTDGNVVLSGTVNSWMVKNEALDAAMYTIGVKNVDATSLVIT